MQIISILITLLFLVLIGLYLYAPFLERRARRVTQEEHELSALLAERERALNALQELDFDYKLGKVPEDEYPGQRTSLLQKGAQVLKRIDELTPQKREDVEDERIERAVEARRRKKTDKNLNDDEIEAMLAARRKGRSSKSAGFCPNCGKPVLASDKFCPSCGKVLG